jgi:hypothetical protein
MRLGLLWCRAGSRKIIAVRLLGGIIFTHNFQHPQEQGRERYEEDTFPLAFSGNILIVDRLIEMSLMHRISWKQQMLVKCLYHPQRQYSSVRLQSSRCSHSKYVPNQAGTKSMAPIFEVTTSNFPSTIFPKRKSIGSYGNYIWALLYFWKS